ncbi:protein BUNDLE SHEATH DEFECTIVE 2, chloroplastic [Mercurialis annua]|uniref:protein BUNDLE SHEATH DEFECTIVE 2, chloroplastic n=1 Tax=Mercurialis annua TaxID=3986 RepID=UPI00215F3637|nr:protein BUNDLE SHEATH DEFECTIVE 2, chloroplastic [Mercurialis annua]
MISKPLKTLISGAAICVGGLAALNITSALAMGAFRQANEHKLRKNGMPCGVCRGKGFYICKLCKGDATIKWSPLYDPIVINPCLCPTCDGHRVQRCLNCRGKGYA